MNSNSEYMKKNNNIKKKCQYCKKLFEIVSQKRRDKKETYCNDCKNLIIFRNRYVSNICTIL